MLPTLNNLWEKVKELGVVHLIDPTGPEGLVMRIDLERAIAEHYGKEQMAVSWGFRARMILEELMLPYPYTRLEPIEQERIWTDDSGWVLEKKHEGFRMFVSYHPKEGFRFFGCNRSSVTLLPVDRTPTIAINGKLGSLYKNAFPEPFALETDIISIGNTRVNIILSSNVLHPQADELKCKVVDYIPFSENLCLRPMPYKDRRRKLERICKMLDDAGLTFFQLVPQVATDKRSVFEHLVSLGHKEFLLRYSEGLYTPCVTKWPVKQTVVKVTSSESRRQEGEIYAYVTGSGRTDASDKKGLISSLQLSVHLKHADGSTTTHWIATATRIPDKIRQELSTPGPIGPVVKEEYFGRVLLISGYKIDPRNNRIIQPKVDWKTGFLPDKTSVDCMLDADFLVAHY